MKIVHISTSDILGGAAIAANRLHNAMLDSNIQSKLVVQDKYGFCSNGIVLISALYRKLFSSLSNKIENKITKSKPEYGKFSFPILGINPLKYKDVLEADIIYIHWINGGILNFLSILRLLKRKKKVFFVLHDMWHITGGCHHSFECNKYMTGCSNCRMLIKPRTKDISYYGFIIKRWIYNKYPNLTFITPSNWLTSCAKNSLLTKKHKVYTIPNLVDLDVFKPISDQQSLKSYLTDHPAKKIIAFGAESGHHNPYKGFLYLVKAIQHLEEKCNIQDDIVLLVIGCKEDLNIKSQFLTKTFFIDRLTDDISMTVLYNSMDVFVTPSLAESFCLMALEAISCGTPVVAFNVGGIPDIVKQDINGNLAESRNSLELAKYIYKIITSDKQDPTLLRKSILHFSKEAVIQQHVDLWNNC